MEKKPKLCDVVPVIVDTLQSRHWTEQEATRLDILIKNRFGTWYSHPPQHEGGIPQITSRAEVGEGKYRCILHVNDTALLMSMWKEGKKVGVVTMNPVRGEVCRIEPESLLPHSELLEDTMFWLLEPLYLALLTK